ncbi:uncharacterized protein LOC123194981 [Mangifera indica]|uniref:uncharacterized protein LOC123194981 n=1 Tax=Mangifera indica TaxID=29780 RepID=UPI001CFAB5B1|nr:uncharacterized protein LOC123194981 [Mangifera indica]
MASSSNSSLPAVLVFNGVHYHIWVVKMKSFLQAADLWDVVEIDGNFPTMLENPTVAQIQLYKSETKKKSKTLSFLHSAIADNIFVKIVYCTTTKQVWEKLQQEYQGSKKTRTMKIITLKRQLENTRMNDTESVSQYSDRIMKLVNEMRILGKDLSEERIVAKVLVSLLEKFESKISSLEDSRDITSISLADLMSALVPQKQQRKMRKKFCYRKQEQQNLEPLVQQNQQLNVAEEEKNEEYLFMMMDAQKQNHSWIIDSGCTQHMTSNAKLFTHIEKSNGVVRMRNGEKVPITGKCTVALQTNSDSNGLEFKCVPMKNKSFVVDWNTIEPYALCSRHEDESLLWHKRLGHCNFNSIQLAQKKNFVSDLPSIEVSDKILEFSTNS